MATTDNSTQQITITLPADLVRSVRARVESGEYASESEFACESIVRSTMENASGSDAGWGPSDEWLVQRALPALDALDADPSSGVPMEDVQAELLRRRTSRQQKAA